MLDPAAAERARSLKDQAVCLRHNGHRGCTAKKFDKRLSCKADRVSLDFSSRRKKEKFLAEF